MPAFKLYMLIVGCRPKGRLTEQHDVFFGIGKSLKDLIPQIKNSWPAAGSIHIDSWREVNQVEGFKIQVTEKKDAARTSGKLFFINLGGYKENDMEEYHYKILTVAPDKSKAISIAKKSAFFKHTNSKTKGGNSHIDDQYGIDVDDIYKIEDALNADVRDRFSVNIFESSSGPEDSLHIGYLSLTKL